MGIDDVIERVERAGDANRRTMQSNSPWLPAADSPLWGVYGRYCKETKQPIGVKVGRCHFWHVVLFFAPLRWLFHYLSKPAGMSFPAALLLMALVVGVEYAIGWMTGIWWAFPAGVGGIAMVLGALGGLFAYIALTDDDNDIGDLIGEVVGDEKFSWGAIALLLSGPGLLAGLLVGFLIHCIIKACGWILDTSVVEFVVDTVSKAFKWAAKAVRVAALVAAIPLLVFAFIYMCGLLVTVAMVGLLVFLLATVWRFQPKLKALDDAAGKWFEARQQRKAAVITFASRRPSLFRRVFGGVKTAFCVVRDLVRLAFTAAVYGYKQICDLAPVPEHLWKEDATPASV